MLTSDSLLKNIQQLNCYKTFKLMYFGFHDATINIHFFFYKILRIISRLFRYCSYTFYIGFFVLIVSCGDIKHVADGCLII